MESVFYSLHEFMLHTKSVLYLLIIAILLGMTGFWRFLNERNTEDQQKDEPH